MGDNVKLVVESKVRAFVGEVAPDLRVSGEFLADLQAEVRATVRRATERAAGNRRRTLRPADL